MAFSLAQHKESQFLGGGCASLEALDKMNRRSAKTIFKLQKNTHEKKVIESEITIN